MTLKDEHEVNFNHHTAAFVADPYAIYAELRDQCPVAHTESHGGFWLLTRYEDVRKALMDWETFTSSHPGTIAIPPTRREDNLPLLPIESDPPAHTQYRSSVARLFSRKKVDEINDQVTTLAREIIARFAPDGRCDLVGDYAEPLFSSTLAVFLKLPLEDTRLWREWADAIFAGRVNDPAGALAARRALAGYVDNLLEQRRQNPGEDVISALFEVALDGVPLNLDELRGYTMEILLAGREATIDGITNSLHYLAHNVEARRHLIDHPDLMASAVEEFLRLVSPIQLLGRITTHEVTVHGVTIPEGSTVAMTFGAANHDERQFENPAACLLDRSPNSHLAFGAGPHTCIGAHLARLGMRVALREFLSALPDYQIDPTNPPERKLNGDARGFVRLPIIFSQHSGVSSDAGEDHAR